MILAILHCLACVVLAGASIRWRFRDRSGEGAHKFLFPFIMVATVTAALVVLFYGWEVFTLYYGGTYYVVGTSVGGFHFDFRWLVLAAFSITLLPGLGLFPPMGRRPVLMAGTALLAMVPAAISVTAMSN